MSRRAKTLSSDAVKVSLPKRSLRTWLRGWLRHRCDWRPADSRRPHRYCCLCHRLQVSTRTGPGGLPSRWEDVTRERPFWMQGVDQSPLGNAIAAVLLLVYWITEFRAGEMPWPQAIGLSLAISAVALLAYAGLSALVRRYSNYRPPGAGWPT